MLQHDRLKGVIDTYSNKERFKVQQVGTGLTGIMLHTDVFNFFIDLKDCKISTNFNTFLDKVTKTCKSIFVVKDKNQIKNLKEYVKEFDKLCDETEDLSPDESKSLKEIYNHILKKVDQWNLIDDKKLLEVHSLFKSIKCDSIAVLEDEYRRFYNAVNKWCRLCLNEKYTINEMDILQKKDYELISNSLKELNEESKKYKNEEIDDKKFATEFLSFITDFKEKILSKFKNEEEQKANPPIHRVATIIKNYKTRLDKIIKQN